ncbi:hypothetical protein CCDG5_0603 [[Clostridium] cellulosi]|jgi:RNase3 domain.|uniref:Mini-ribonuclease 3 n=1 Tax=[Clostridium] cellulosi TaxID=29343 RepID=A0A078KRH7_9FIRM|nr:hypothetical protein CCDG5_0603 [[Clostridium] cellulosi]
MSNNTIENVKSEEINAESLSPITLAFMGDAVYETLVRDYLITELKLPAAKLHQACVSFVNATAQAEAVKLLMPHLSQEELTILRRGRNANTAHVPKNATPADYHYATGLEALFGYLFLKRKTDRIYEIFNFIVQLRCHNETLGGNSF